MKFIYHNVKIFGYNLHIYTVHLYYSI